MDGSGVQGQGSAVAKRSYDGMETILGPRNFSSGLIAPQVLVPKNSSR